MKITVFLFFIGLSAAAIVKRDAEPEAEADADADAEADPGLYRHHGGYAAKPVCTITPVKECKPRQVETPRKVCQTVVDIHEDVVVTEHCEEVVTTECTQTSQTAAHSSAVVDKSTRLVKVGVPAPLNHAAPVVAHAVSAHGRSYGKRDADAEPDADADPYYRHGGYGRRHYYAAPAVAHAVAVPVVAHSAPAKSVSPPVCSSVPVKQCNKVPHSTPRKVSRVVCDTVVDVTTIEDCHETVTKTCQHTSTSHASHSAVVGHDTKVIATAVEVPVHHAGYHG